MGGEKLTTISQDEWPDLLAIRVGNRQPLQLRTRKERKPTFPNTGRNALHPRADLEQKHQPVRRPGISVFAHDSRQMQVGRAQAEAQLLLRFPTGTRPRRFARGGFQLPAWRAPKTPIRFLEALDQKHAIRVIKDVEQRRYLVRQGHRVARSRQSRNEQTYWQMPSATSMWNPLLAGTRNS